MVNLTNVISGLGKALPAATANYDQVKLAKDQLIDKRVSAMAQMQQAEREREDRLIKETKEDITKRIEDLATYESDVLTKLVLSVDPAQFGEAATEAHKQAQEGIADLVDSYNQQFGRKVFSATEFTTMFDAKVKQPLTQAMQQRQKENDAKTEVAGKVATFEAAVGRYATPEEKFAIGAGAQFKTFRDTDPEGNPIEIAAMVGPTGEVLREISRGPIQNTGTNIEIGKGEGEFEKFLGTRLGKMVESGGKAHAKLESIGRVMQLLEQFEAAGGDTGALSALAVQAGNVLNSIGLGDFAKRIGVGRDETEFGQALQGATRQLIGGLIGTDEGAILPANLFTEADREVVMSTVPQISDLGGGFRLKALAYQKVADRAAQIGERVLELQAEGNSVADISKQIAKEFGKNSKISMFTPEELAAIMAAPKAVDGAAGGARVITYQELLDAAGVGAKVPK